MPPKGMVVVVGAAFMVIQQLLSFFFDTHNINQMSVAPAPPVLYFDGGCRAKVAGAACLVVSEKRIYYQRLTKTIGAYPTNNHAELHGLYLALNAAVERGWLDAIEIRGDSLYAMKVSNGEYQAHTNQELVARNRALVARFRKIHWVHVKGHSKEKHNELVDQFATQAILKTPDDDLHSVVVDSL